MKFESLIAEFGSCYGIGDLVPDEDGVVTIRASRSRDARVETEDATSVAQPAEEEVKCQAE